LKKSFLLEQSIGWQVAIVKEVNQFNAKIETEKNIKGIIEYKDISWTKKILENY
jgi:penicillin-binding protein 1A